jgi:hypothetical protein
MEDVIAAYDAEPPREAILDNDRINQVAESMPYEGTKPGTILPSKKYADEAKAAKSTVIIPQESADGVLDLDGLSASKGTPDKKGDALNLDSLPSSTSPRSSLKSSALPAAPKGVSGSFVVLELAKKDDAKKDLPFLTKGSRGIGGLIIPNGSPENALTFFSSGGHYAYLWNKQVIPLKVRATYPTVDAARMSYPGIGNNWYTLSPYEIMNLGKGPWSKKGSAR